MPTMPSASISSLTAMLSMVDVNFLGALKEMMAMGKAAADKEKAGYTYRTSCNTLSPK